MDGFIISEFRHIKSIVQTGVVAETYFSDNYTDIVYLLIYFNITLPVRKHLRIVHYVINQIKCIK
jgi:hypothetical protein